MNIKSKIKRWYLGGPLPVEENICGGKIVRAPNTFEPSASARFAQWVVKNILKIISIIVAAFVALFIHFDGKATNAPAHHEKTNSVSQEIFHKEPPK